MNVLPPGVTAPVLVLRSLLVLLPCAALALALPEVPHLVVVTLVVVCSAWWAYSPDHPAGAVALLLVGASQIKIGWREHFLSTLFLLAMMIGFAPSWQL